MSAPSRPPAPSQESIATWQGIFAGGPYTALKMVEYILIANRKNPGEFIADPVRTTQGVTDSIIVAGRHSLKDMQPIWAGKTGRCTSFAVKAVTQLSAYKDRSRRQIYNFAIYDLAGHRIARCLQTGTVIDSSSTMPTGAFVLLEGQWQKFEKTEASWKFKSSESKFERAGDATGKVAASSTALTPEQAMYMCLGGVEGAIKYSIPTLFRSVAPNGQPVYHGLISWMPYKHCIELVPDISPANKKKRLIIQWAKLNSKGAINQADVGTDADLATCVEALENFVKVHGGPNGPAQWAADGINGFSDQLFAASTVMWGSPKLINKLA